MESKNLNESDIVLYCNFHSNFNNKLKELGFQIKPFALAPQEAIEIGKDIYTEYKSIINKFNKLIMPLDLLLIQPP